MEAIIVTTSTQVIVDARSNGVRIPITKYILGSQTSVDFTPTIATTDVGGTKVYSGTISSFRIKNRFLISFDIILGADIGPFSYGNIGIYTEDSDGNDVLFAVGARSTAVVKTNSSGFGNMIKEVVDITSEGLELTSIIDFTQYSKLTSIGDDFTAVPDSNIHVLKNADHKNNSAILIRKNVSEWDISTHTELYSGTVIRNAGGSVDLATSTTLVTSYDIPPINLVRPYFLPGNTNVLNNTISISPKADAYTNDYTVNVGDNVIRCGSSSNSVHFSGTITVDFADPPLTQQDSWSNVPNNSPYCLIVKGKFYKHTKGTAARSFCSVFGRNVVFSQARSISHNMVKSNLFSSRVIKSNNDGNLLFTINNRDIDIEDIMLIRTGTSIVSLQSFLDNPAISTNTTAPTVKQATLHSDRAVLSGETYDFDQTETIYEPTAYIKIPGSKDNVNPDLYSVYNILLTRSGDPQESDHWVTLVALDADNRRIWSDLIYMDPRTNTDGTLAINFLLKVKNSELDRIAVYVANGEFTVRSIIINRLGVDLAGEGPISFKDNLPHSIEKGKYLVQMTSGALAGQIRQIVATQYCYIEVEEAFDSVPQTGDSFKVYKSIHD